MSLSSQMISEPRALEGFFATKPSRMINEWENQILLRVQRPQLRDVRTKEYACVGYR